MSWAIAGLQSDATRAALSVAPFGGSESSWVGTGFLGLTPPGYELSPLAGLRPASQRNRGQIQERGENQELAASLLPASSSFPASEAGLRIGNSTLMLMGLCYNQRF